MKVHLIKKQSIENYVRENAQSRIGLQNWLSILRKSDWKNPKDIIESYNNADILGNGADRIIFNIGGNKYRMICFYVFGKKEVHLFVKWIGTHSEYTELCKKGKQFIIDQFRKKDKE